MRFNNILLDTDSYKSSHYLQYPPGTDYMYSYLEARKDGDFDRTVFFGLQYIMDEYLLGPVFSMGDIKEAEEIFALHGVPFNKVGWTSMYQQYEGRLPIRIKAVPEGLVVPCGNVLLSVESTDPKFFWIVNYLEDIFVRLWYPCTVATVSWHCKKLIGEYLDKTSDEPNQEIYFKLHDFGARGVSSNESAAIGGAAHLVNFVGSDTVLAIPLLQKHYSCRMPSASIPAAEHSTITSWGKNSEVDAYRNMLGHFAKPGSLVAVVSDSYDLENAVSNIWGGILREEVINSGATLILRPDSGNPTQVVLDTVKNLATKFGCQKNSKDYYVLNNVRVIQGDGICYEEIESILKALTEHRFSTTNVAFGMGGGLLQKVHRDTMRFAFKCSCIRRDGQYVDVSKTPTTDPTKASKAGRLDLIRDSSGNFHTLPWGRSNEEESLLQKVFENGEVLGRTTLQEVRLRSEEYWRNKWLENEKVNYG